MDKTPIMTMTGYDVANVPPFDSVKENAQTIYNMTVPMGQDAHRT